ncbi:MAG: protein kinase [Akkermansia sp.]|nr:protein kinase [Akkermansia sp.]
MESTDTKQNNGTGHGMALPVGAELGDYRILRKLGQGGFGITYLVVDLRNGEKLVLKENMPMFCAYRKDDSFEVLPRARGKHTEEYLHFQSRFVEEAGVLRQLHHPNIVHVRDAFCMNGTAYYTMDYVGGSDLHNRPPIPESITEEWLKTLLQTLLSALDYLHAKKLLHRDIKPANILLKEDGTPVLIDFGTARDIAAIHSATMVHSEGYTPLEQISADGNRGPWSDLYALAATCCALITGKRPPSAANRVFSDPYIPLCTRPELSERFSLKLLASIDKALSMDVEERWQSATEWNVVLSSADDKVPWVPRPRPENQQKHDLPADDETTRVITEVRLRNRRRKFRIAAACLAGACLLAGGYGLYSYSVQPENPEQPRLAPAPQVRTNDAACAKFVHNIQELFLHTARPQPESLPPKPTAELLNVLRALAQQGGVAEQFALGVVYQYGLGVEKDEKLAMECLRQAADAGNPLAQTLLAQLLVETDDAETLPEAVKWYRAAAEQGHAVAQYELGCCCKNGVGMEKNHEEAFKWYRLATEQGYATAQYELGRCYQYGLGVENDYAQALKWYSRSAHQGIHAASTHLLLIGEKAFGGDDVARAILSEDPPLTVEFVDEILYHLRRNAIMGSPLAQNNFGWCCENGVGRAINEPQAVMWYRKAAEQGHAAAQYNLGRCYETGTGVQKDSKEAAKWYLLAAVRGYAEARCALGLCYENGIVVEKNEAEAAKWFRMAAEHEHARAMYHLGRCYQEGIGVQKNAAEAHKWYYAALVQGDAMALKWCRAYAEQGNAEAQFYMGHCLEVGIVGIEQDVQEALKWYHKSADQGNTSAQSALGFCYGFVASAEVDPEEALAWFMKAAENGYSGVSACVGMSYEYESRVEEILKVAVKSYIKAAEQGDAEAQYNLGECYENGYGVAIDKAQAMSWYNKAAQQEHSEAKSALIKLKNMESE